MMWMNQQRLGMGAAIAAIAMAGMLQRVVRADEGIIVQGSGEAKGRPTEVEITGSLAGDSELAADAVVKFHDAKKKALAAMDALKNPNLSVSSEGIAINSPIDANAQQMMMRGQTVTPTQKVQVQETSRIVLANTDKIEPEALLEQVLKILDVAKDSGFVIGPPAAGNYYEMQMRAGQPSSMVVFKLPDATALREAATKLAVEDAKDHAQKIADLAGVKLGRILSVSQDGVKTDSNSQAMSIYQLMYGGGGSSEKPDNSTKGLMGATSAELKIRINITVQFEIAK